VTGIEKLYNADLPNMKIVTILTAIKENYKPKFEKIDCDICSGSGVVSMVDTNGCNIAFACRCKAGQIKLNNGFPRWAGLHKQKHGEETLTVYLYKLLGEEEYKKLRVA
jgi:hypothetical protein